MSSPRFECLSCHAPIERDGAFCRHCGRRVETLAEEQGVLDRTGSAAFRTRSEGCLPIHVECGRIAQLVRHVVPTGHRCPVRKTIMGIPFSQSTEDFRGTWMPIVDVKKDLLLGLHLDGLKSGEPFKLAIPFHRKLGNQLVGTDNEGVTCSSRNLQPREKGF